MLRSRIPQNSTVDLDRIRWESYKKRPAVWNRFFKKIDHNSNTTTIIAEELKINYKSIQIDSLNSDCYVLKRPITITIERDDNSFIANSYDVGLYAVGDTEIEAIDDLKALIVEVYNDLLGEESLQPIPKRMLLFLKEVIQER